MHWGNFGGMGFGGFSFGWTFMVLFWVLVILGVIYLIQYMAGDRNDRGHENTALEILQKRYASGEISRAEFKERKAVITRST